jgi:Trk-type K+ transport system membrane component
LLQVLLEWMKGQPFSNVMSFLQLSLLAGLGWAAMAWMIPAERQAILDAIQKQEADQTRQIDRITESFEKALDRFTPGQKHDPVVSKE